MQWEEINEDATLVLDVAFVLRARDCRTGTNAIHVGLVEPTGDSDLVYRVLGVLGILLASITVVTPVLHKLSSSESDSDRIDAEIARLRARLVELEKLKAGTTD